MEDGPAPPWVFSNRVLDEAVLALQQDKIPTAEQMAALHGAANPSAPPARAPKPSNFTPPPPRTSRRWEDFTYTNESGRGSVGTAELRQAHALGGRACPSE